MSLYEKILTLRVNKYLVRHQLKCVVCLFVFKNDPKERMKITKTQIKKMDFIILLLKSIVVWSSSINWWEEIFYSLHRNSSVLENMVYAWRKFICSFLILFLLKSITKIHPIAYNQFWLKNILATSLLLEWLSSKRQEMTKLERIWREGDPASLLVGA